MIEHLKTLFWIEELLPPDIVQKRMHGGIGYYLDEKLVLVLIESSRTTEHKGISYPFELWRGCFFPIVKIKQNAVIAKFPFLENHPATKHWLYLPAETEEFEDHVKLVIRDIIKRNPLFGTEIKESAAAKRARENADDEIIDTRKPSLFNTDAPAKKTAVVKEKIAKARTKPTQKIKANKKPENALILSILKRRST